MTKRTVLTIVLAAGEGTRMRSDLPKVLNPLAGETLLAHVLKSMPTGRGTSAAVVIGPRHQAIAEAVKRLRPDAAIFIQQDRQGTAHAVLAARAAIAAGADDLIVVFGDTPLISASTLERLRVPLGQGSAIVVLGFRAAVPTGYGRLIMDGEQLVAICEEAEASPQQRAVTLCNAGAMALQGAHALHLLDGVGNENAKTEYYLTDAVQIARTLGLKASVVETTEDEVRGINTKSQLAEAEAVMQRRLREAAMAAGVTMIAPETVYLVADTRFGRDVVIEPFVVFGPGVTVGDGAVIRSFSHLVDASIGKNASVGPYARLRPGTVLGEHVHIGNFVELKAATIDAGTKANHLAYLGDTHVGPNANIGAGTITCNYDGFGKYRTEIGANAFIGSNSALVAPITIGEGAYVGAGSVVTKDVPADALVVERSQQTVRPGWAQRFREMKLRAKAALTRPK
jgi:bifunctional UDP-N-acetylglucosamine pyrophosphorylase / glucosamine-1-phosphate N-acetyltransferase